MSMPLDLYVIRHGESEANIIVQAGEQGDNSLYTQDPDICTAANSR